MQHSFQQQRFPAPGGYPTWLLLAALEHGPKDVALLLHSVEQQTGIIYEPGTLYRWIAALERRGWIERGESNEERARYRITAAGVAALYGEYSKESSIAKVYEQKKRRYRISGVKENSMRIVSWIV